MAWPVLRARLLSLIGPPAPAPAEPGSVHSEQSAWSDVRRADGRSFTGGLRRVEAWAHACQLRKVSRCLAVSSALAVLGPTTASAATFYVSPSGSDSSSGTTASTPWRTLAKVNATTLAPGDQVLFEGGQTFSGELDPNGSGTEGSSTTYGSYGAGRAIISGHPATYPTGVSYVTYQHLILDAGNRGDCVDTYSGSAAIHIIFDNVEIRNCVFGINQSRASDAYWTIQNSWVHDTSDSGIVITGPSHSANGGNFIIRNNRIEDTGTGTSAPSGGDAHGIYDDSPGSQIVNNDIGNFQTDGISLRYRNSTVEGNTIHDGMRTTCCASGVAYYNYDITEAPGGGTSTLRFNRIWNVPYGVLISGEQNHGSAPGPENWLIYNNTISGSAARSGALRTLISYDSGTTGALLSIQNNVLLGASGDQLYVGRRPATYREDYNDWAAAGAGGRGTGDISLNPDLAGAPSFAPSTNSPVINAGTLSVARASFGLSCDGGYVHYCGGAPDMGAVAHGGTMPPRSIDARGRNARAHHPRKSDRSERHGSKRSHHRLVGPKPGWRSGRPLHRVSNRQDVHRAGHPLPDRQHLHGRRRLCPRHAVLLPRKRSRCRR